MRYAGALLLLALVRHDARAQGGYEIEVYPSDVAPRHSLLFELHTNYTFSGPQSSGAAPLDDDLRAASFVSFDPVCNNASTPFVQRIPLNGAMPSFRIVPDADASIGCALNGAASSSNTLHEMIEVVAGATSWSEIAAYAFASKQGSAGAQWQGAAGRAKLQIPRSWRWPVGLALSTEVEYERSPDSEGSWTWEIRPILDRTAGRWYIALNPVLERGLRGPDVVDGLHFSPSGKVSYDFTPHITGGLEYYGAYGRVGAFAAEDNRLQQLFSTIDLHVSPVWEINLGVGAGMTPATDQLVAKLILGRTLTW